MMSAAQLAALRAEILSDSKGLGYAPFFEAGADSLVADLLNARTGSGAEVRGVSSISGDEAKVMFLPAILALGQSTDASLKSKWVNTLPILGGAQSFTVSGAAQQALIAELIADGLVSPPQVDYYTTRVFSRGEILFGEHFTVEHGDVSAAMREIS